MKKYLFVFLLTCVLASCSDKNTEVPKRSLEYFTTWLKPDMKFNELTTRFGPPDADRGSGIHIYMYKLIDGTSIVIGFADRILYARHVDANDQVLHTIL